MQDYYIRTPDNDASRGPFDEAKLRSLAEAGQVSENTLYYDEEKEEWVPIGLNAELKTAVFPQRERLSLKIRGEDANDPEHAADKADKDDTGIDVQSMLAAADGDTEETRHLRRQRESCERAISIAPPFLGIMMGLSGLFLLLPHLEIVQTAFSDGPFNRLLSYPFLLIAFFDLIVALALLLAVTEVYPFVRGRVMLTVGFGLYLGWAMGEPAWMLAFAAAGIGPFVATVAQRLSLMIAAILIGIAGNGYLAYLAASGRFAGFFEVIQLGGK